MIPKSSSTILLQTTLRIFSLVATRLRVWTKLRLDFYTQYPHQVMPSSSSSLVSRGNLCTTIALLIVVLEGGLQSTHGWNPQQPRRHPQKQQYHQNQYHHPTTLPELPVVPAQEVESQKQRIKSHTERKQEGKVTAFSRNLKQFLDKKQKQLQDEARRAERTPKSSPSTKTASSSFSSSSSSKNLSSRKEEDDSSSSDEDMRESTRDPIWRPPKLRYYAILGVESTATSQQIKTNYRKLAKIYHPGEFLFFFTHRSHTPMTDMEGILTLLPLGSFFFSHPFLVIESPIVDTPLLVHCRRESSS